MLVHRMPKGCTPAEAILARALTRSHIPFLLHRQVAGYEIDFVLPNRIAIEVDGYVHCQTLVARKDRCKDELLGALGWRVVRFTNEQARSDTRRCLAAIQRAAAQAPRTPAARPLAPWQQALQSLRPTADAR